MSIQVKVTRKTYEKYLNQNSPEQGSEQWIIGGTIRMHHMWTNQYGTALRKYDPVAFNVGYNEWKREQ